MGYGELKRAGNTHGAAARRVQKAGKGGKYPATGQRKGIKCWKRQKIPTAQRLRGYRKPGKAENTHSTAVKRV